MDNRPRRFQPKTLAKTLTIEEVQAAQLHMDMQRRELDLKKQEQRMVRERSLSEIVEFQNKHRVPVYKKLTKKYLEMVDRFEDTDVGLMGLDYSSKILARLSQAGDSFFDYSETSSSPSPVQNNFALQVLVSHQPTPAQTPVTDIPVAEST